MGSESAAPPERAFAYWNGWHAVGCSVLFFGLLGSIGVSLFPAGYEKVQSGQLPTGIALMVMGVFGVPTLLMSFWSLWTGVRDTLSPPRVRVTTTSLFLPTGARGEPPQDEHGEPISHEPPHPATIPLAAIRSVRRAGPVHNLVLEVLHDASAVPLRLSQHMMRKTDFDDLEAVLRAAIPGAFAAP
ncbi:hypothetical protein VT84_05610 [Gemmata sp. SH-PL17]|uniref:hypothetical protein n=1 Tax=Gemmata sp. SH-PL17 TaxID=1630693 RepID=UPI00078D4292|nr:hypothetical protein [Gemmata sp. SH-PL17]AMV23869.1 hypothetical protein VT84_05610 [Gemmata sp. SH-PL17]